MNRKLYTILAVATLFFVSCSKSDTQPNDSADLPDGEFFIRAKLNGQTIFYANDVNGHRWEPFFGTSLSQAGSTIQYGGARLQLAPTPSDNNNAFIVFDTELLRNPANMVGNKYYYFRGIAGTTQTAGVCFNNKPTWDQPSNNSTNNFVQVVSVVNYNYPGSTNLKYYKITVNFVAKLRNTAGAEETITDGEAVLLVATP
jgi:hypothetical protein